jgi:hypothetical protein
MAWMNKTDLLSVMYLLEVRRSVDEVFNQKALMMMMMIWACLCSCMPW